MHQQPLTMNIADSCDYCEPDLMRMSKIFVPGQPDCAGPCAGVFPSGQQPHLVDPQDPPDGPATLLNAETKKTVKNYIQQTLKVTHGYSFLRKNVYYSAIHDYFENLGIIQLIL